MVDRETYEQKVAREEQAHARYTEEKKRVSESMNRPPFWTQAHTDRELSGERVDPPYIPEKRE